MDSRQAQASKRPRVTITVEGGVIQAVEADAPVDVLVVDYDSEGCSEEDIRRVGNGDALVAAWPAHVNPDNIARIFREAGDSADFGAD